MTTQATKMEVFHEYFIVHEPAAISLLGNDAGQRLRVIRSKN